MQVFPNRLALNDRSSQYIVLQLDVSSTVEKYLRAYLGYIKTLFAL